MEESSYIMPQDIKIWEINGQADLREIPKLKLDLEERLEDWIRQDISILSEDYLVIGRQVPTEEDIFRPL